MELKIVSSTPDEIIELARACRQYVERAVGVGLDGTQDTLPLLDHYLSESREAIRDRSELEPLLVRSAGAYFGEVIRATFDGFWYCPNRDSHQWLVCLRTAFLACNPVGAIYDALFLAESHPGPSSHLHLAPEDQPLVEARLSEIPLVAARDYYRLSTRFEVLEVAFNALRATMIEGGQQDVLFDIEDYVADEDAGRLG